MSEAESSFQEAVKISSEYSLAGDRTRAFRNLVELNYRRGDYREAISYADQADPEMHEPKQSTIDIRLDWKPRLHLCVENFEEAQRVLRWTGFAVADSKKKIFSSDKKVGSSFFCNFRRFSN